MAMEKLILNDVHELLKIHRSRDSGQHVLVAY